MVYVCLYESLNLIEISASRQKPFCSHTEPSRFFSPETRIGAEYLEDNTWDEMGDGQTLYAACGYEIVWLRVEREC